MPVTTLYGQPSGRSAGSGGSGRNVDRCSPASTNPISSRAASRMPSSVCNRSTSAASSPLTRCSSSSCAWRWSIFTSWSNQVWTGSTNTAAAMVPPTSRISRPPNSATLGLRRVRFSTGIGRVKSPRRERPSSEAFGGVLGREMEVVPERLTTSILASEPPESASHQFSAAGVSAAHACAQPAREAPATSRTRREEEAQRTTSPLPERRQGGTAAVLGVVAEGVFDAQQLVVLGHPVAARRCARLDLAAVGGDGEIRDGGVLGLARSVAHHRGVGVTGGEADGVEGLGERSDLVHLHQDRVGDALVDP